MSRSPAYIVAARRTAMGRVGGLHRNRRIEALAAPVVTAALQDARIAPEQVDEIIIGNASAGGNPARLIALAAGLPEEVPALTLDRQCASGLDAILAAIRLVGAGEADVVVAGGAESLSTAPWRIAKPPSLYQLPHFMTLGPDLAAERGESALIAAAEHLARAHGLSRKSQDGLALRSHRDAARAAEERRFVGEIVPLRCLASEARDESVNPALSEDELADLPAYHDPDGVITPGNSSRMHDGAAMLVVVSERVWAELGRPPAIRLIAAVASGVAHARQGAASIAAMQKLESRLNGAGGAPIDVVEISETSAAEILALAETLDLPPERVNPDGGAIARGRPFGASGSVLVTRLFTHLARLGAEGGEEAGAGRAPRRGAATMGAIGGLGLAALFEAVRE